MENRRVVVTGMGAVTSLGNDVETFWSNIKAGKCGIDRIKAFEPEGRATLASEVNIDLKEYLTLPEVKRIERYIALAMIAGREAITQSRIDITAEDAYRCGVLISSGVGGISTIVREQTKGAEKGFDRVSPFFIPMSIVNMASGQVAIDTGFKGMCTSVVTACAGGTNAIGDAMRAIRHGYADVMLCGGTEACVLPLTIGGFTSMKALTESDNPKRASIPFDAERNGFVLGEGAAVLVLEEYERAKARGADIFAEITGYGSRCDAYHITAPEPTGECAAQTMAEAIADAGLKPGDIDYINAHGTSTPMNDRIETMAIKKALGPAAQSVSISSTKSMTGHLLGAAGAIEAIVGCMAIRDGYIPATIGYENSDPECDLDIVPNVGRTAQIRHVMSNSLGFGGHNASIIISKI